MTTPQSNITWRKKEGKTPLEKINKIAISVISNVQHPGRSHVFIRKNRIVALLFDKSIEEYTNHDFYISAKRPRISTDLIWNWVKNHPSKPMFWLLHQFEEVGTIGGLQEIDPTPIINFLKDLEDQKIMFLTLNPKLPSNWGLPYQIACRCQCCAEVFVVKDGRQRFCTPECCTNYHNIKRKNKALKEKRSRMNKEGAPRCVVCGGLLSGRSDALTCGDQCRQRKCRDDKTKN